MQQAAVQTHIKTRLPYPHQGKRVFAFDLDGTITKLELLPIIARHSGVEAELRELTRRTLIGEIGFEASFRRRFAMLRQIPLPEVHDRVASVPLEPHIVSFIKSRREECVIVTGNLDLWVMPLLERLGCRYFASRGVLGEKGLSLLSVLDKGAAARCLLRERCRLIAIGESTNDLPLFRVASVGIAYAGVHSPVPAISQLATFEAKNGEDLCRLLDKY